MYQGYLESGYKECYKCGEVHPLTTEFFHRDKPKPKGFSNTCKVCAKETRHISLLTGDNKRKWRENGKARRAENTEKHFQTSPHADPSNTKHCNTCNRELSVVMFAINRSADDGLFFRCKECAKNAIYKDPSKIAKMNEATRRWRKENPEKHRQNSLIAGHRRRARKANTLYDFTAQDWQYALEYFNGCCAVCGRQMNDMFGEFTAARDHWHSLAKGGHTIPENIVPLCHGIGGCNTKKGAKDPAQWLTETYGSRRANAILEKVETFFSTVRSTREEKAS